VIWNPTSNQEGSYTLSATFTLLEPSGHTNYYGLVFGGRELDASSQNYLYFLVAQNGTFILSHRANDEAVHSVVARTGHDAIATPGDDGRSVNALEVRVGADEIELVVNGTVVHTQARSGMAARTDGIAGVRVNHQLDVEVSGFSTATARSRPGGAVAQRSLDRECFGAAVYFATLPPVSSGGSTT